MYRGKESSYKKRTDKEKINKFLTEVSFYSSIFSFITIWAKTFFSSILISFLRVIINFLFNTKPYQVIRQTYLPVLKIYLMNIITYKIEDEWKLLT